MANTTNPWDGPSSPADTVTASTSLLGRVFAWLMDSSTRAYISLLALSGFLLFYRLGARGLFEPDEGRYAEIPREMIALSDWITPHLNYVPFFDKPPLAYWFVAAAYRVIGEGALAARLPSAFMTLVAVFATAFFGRRLLGPAKGWLGAVILATALMPLWIGRVVTLDGILASFVTVSIFSFRRALDIAAGQGRERAGWLFLAYVAAALGTLVKGPLAAALPALVIGLHLIVTRRFREIARLRLLSGSVVYLAIAAPWFVLVSQRNPIFAKFYFVGETLMRYVSTTHGHTGSILYYVPVLLLGLAPWSLLLPRAIYTAWRDRRTPNGDEAWFLLIWAASVFLFFSFAGSKHAGYLLPAFPPLALLVARFLLSDARPGVPVMLDRNRWLRWSSLAFPVIPGIVALVLPWTWYGEGGASDQWAMWLIGGICIALGAASFQVSRHKPAAVCVAMLVGWSLALHPVIVHVSERVDERYSVAPLTEATGAWIRSEDQVVQYKGYARGLAFYLRRRIVLYQSMTRELRAGYEVDTPENRHRWFLQDPADLDELLRNPDRVFIVTSHEDLPSLVIGHPGLVRLKDTPRYVLLASRELENRTSSLGHEKQR